MHTKHSAARQGKPGVLVVAGCILLTALLLVAGSFELESEKKAGLVSAVIIAVLALTPRFRQQLRNRCSVFFLLTTAYVILAGASTLYGRAPKLGISDFTRYLAGYAVFLTVFTFSGPGTLARWCSVFSAATAVVSFLSLDGASWGLIANPLLSWVNGLTGGYHIETYGMSASRINGIFGSSNTMAFLCALGIFFSLYLLWQIHGKRRTLPAVALFLNTYAFLMCASMGATLSLGLTVLLLLCFLKGREARLTLALVALETLVCAGLAVLLSSGAFGNESPTGYVVWLCMIGGSAALAALEIWLRDKLVTRLARRLKVLLIALVAVAAALIVLAVVAFSVEKPVTLYKGSYLSKIIYPGGGDCQITLDLDGEGLLRVYYLAADDIVMDHSTRMYQEVYTGSVTVEIPADAVEVGLMVFPAGNEPVTVNGISYEGTARSGHVAPGYRLIPDTILTRLQGLPTNHSSRQRLVMMEDGLKMWKTDPIFGRGMGGYENGLASVQDYYYETSYAHNHFVQCLTELGVVGLALYVGMLVFGFWAVWPLRKRTDLPGLFPALAGILLMVTIHGTIEFSMSVAEGILFAFAGFGLIAAQAPGILPEKAAGKKPFWLLSVPAAALGLLFTVLLSCNLYAKSQISTGEVTLDQLKTFAKIDVFEGNDYRLTYLVNAPALGDEAMAQALEYGQVLMKEDSNANGAILTEFYLQQDMLSEAVTASEQYLKVNRSNPEAWNDQFHRFEAYFDPMLDGDNLVRFVQAEDYIPAFLEVFDAFHQLSETQLDHPQLDEQSAAFEAKLRQCVEAGLSDQEALLQIFSS